MKMKIACMAWAFLIAGALTIATPQGASAQGNDQDFVIGMTLIGIGTVDQMDDARNAFTLQTDVTGVGSFYAEWYLLGRLGISYRFTTTGIKEEGNILGFTYSNEIRTTSHIMAANFMPWISSDGYMRAILVGGVGPSTYTFTQSAGGTTVSASASGNALLGQAAIDWGGESFGARFGFGVMKTTYDQIGAATVDESNKHFNLDLRWAF